MDGCQAEVGDLSGSEEVAQVGAGVGLADHTATLGIDWALVGGVAGFFDVDLAKRGKEGAVAGVAGGHNTVEHIDPTVDIFDQIFGGADPHQVAGLLFGHERGSPGDGIVHILIGFTHTQSSDRKAVKVHCTELSGGLLPESLVGTALNDGKDILINTDPLLLFGTEVVDTLLCPAGGAVDTRSNTLLGSGQGDEIVEDHHDIGAEVMLDIDHLGRGEVVFGAVEVATESDAPLIDLDIVAEGKGLKATTVGQEALGKFGKSMQLTHLGDHIVARADIHMVGVGKDDLWFEKGLKIGCIEGFDGTDGTDRHKDWCLDGRVGSLDGTGAGIAVGFIYLKMHCVIISSLKMGVIIPKNIYRAYDLKNILILADGSIARHFVEWVGRKRIADNRYFVTCYRRDTTPEKLGKNITLIHADPTSYARMKHIMEEVKFTHIFVVMEEREDVLYTLKNIRLIDPKVRIVLANQWDDEEIGKEMENITHIDVNDLMAAHLYDQLPDVPLVAQNVGLGLGEIMEIHVPFGSAYAYRHVGSILQRKWKIAAIYRDDKQILPTNATMIRPNDTLLVVGKPMVLDGVYRTINKRIGLFPEPFGHNLYLLLDFRYDQERALQYLTESVYLVEKLKEKLLFVRVVTPNNFTLIEALRAFENERVTLSVTYEEEDTSAIVEYDIGEHDIGLLLTSTETFRSDTLQGLPYSLKKLTYLFGDHPIYNIHESVVLIGEKEKMESISSTAFDMTESLGLVLRLCDFDPEGDFGNKKMILEHYETLSHIFNVEMKIEQKVANPIREVANMDHILHIIPLEKALESDGLLRIFSTKVEHFLLRSRQHPKLLVPYVTVES